MEAKNEKLLYSIFNSVPGSIKDIIFARAPPRDKLDFKMHEKVLNRNNLIRSDCNYLKGKFTSKHEDI